MQEICATYAAATTLHEQGVHIISVDEKTGIQALEKQITPMKRGQIARCDHSYKRHGTQCLIANLEVATGKIVSPTIGDRRTEADFLKHIKQTIASDPGGTWIFVADQLNTHQSESLVRMVITQCGLQDEMGMVLGKKGKSGILANMTTRAAFLSDTTHRIRFLYTPKHASWMN